jgi:hypothetical protein
VHIIVTLSNIGLCLLVELTKKKFLDKDDLTTILVTMSDALYVCYDILDLDSTKGTKIDNQYEKLYGFFADILGPDEFFLKTIHHYSSIYCYSPDIDNDPERRSLLMLGKVFIKKFCNKTSHIKEILEILKNLRFLNKGNYGTRYILELFLKIRSSSNENKSDIGNIITDTEINSLI